MNITRRFATLSLLALCYRATTMPKDVTFLYSFHTDEASEQTVTATVTRGNVPVAPEPVYIELEATGFTLPAPLHPTLDPALSGLHYETVWKKDGVAITGSYNSPGNLTSNVKGIVRGPRFMWMFEDDGTYTADVTVTNMYDHSEVATTTIGPIVVEHYVDWFTAQGSNAAFFIVSADGDTTGVPAAVLAHSDVVNRASFSAALDARYYRQGKFHCILVKQGETNTDRGGFTTSLGNNLYARTFAGNQGTDRPVLSGDLGLSTQGTPSTIENYSVQISGFSYDRGKDPTDKNVVLGGTKFLSWSDTTPAMIGIHNCTSHGADTSIQCSGGANARGVFWDCDIGGFVQSNMTGGFGKFTSLVGCKLTNDPDGWGSYSGSGSGWSIRHSDEGHIWMNEVGCMAGWDSSDHIQPALRLGAANTGRAGQYIYVGGNTVFSDMSFGTTGTHNESTTANAVVEGNRVGPQSQRLNGAIHTLISGIKAYNNITAYPSARPEFVGTQFNGGPPFFYNGLASNDGPTGWDNTVLSGGLDAQFNTHVSLNDETTTNDTYIIKKNGTSETFTNIEDQNNLLSADYEATPKDAGSVDLSRYGPLTHTTKPYEAYDMPKQNGTGVAEDMVTLAGTGLGFVAGETLTQGGVSAEIYVVQDDGAETRLWVANTTGGAFAAGAVNSASGSGTLSGPAIYRGTMINGTPVTPTTATSKTWVPLIDHYGTARSFNAAKKGAVETA